MVEIIEVVYELLVSHIDIDIQLQSLSRQIVQILLFILPVLVSIIFLSHHVIHLNVMYLDISIPCWPLHCGHIEVLTILVNNLCLSLSLALHEISNLLLNAINPVIIHSIHTISIGDRHPYVVDDARCDCGGSIGSMLNVLREVDLLISER